MARRGKRQYDLEVVTDINVTSLVDVMMTLLIIFIIVAPMIEQGIDVNLPTAEPRKIDVAEVLTNASTLRTSASRWTSSRSASRASGRPRTTWPC